MTLKQVYEKVFEVGWVRAYLSNRGSSEDIFHYGQRGDLKIDEIGYLYFSADCNLDENKKNYFVESALDIHAPSIGHYNW
jgi:hypothetical protein